MTSRRDESTFLLTSGVELGVVLADMDILYGCKSERAECCVLSLFAKRDRVHSYFGDVVHLQVYSASNLPRCGRWTDCTIMGDICSPGDTTEMLRILRGIHTWISVDLSRTDDIESCFQNA